MGYLKQTQPHLLLCTDMKRTLLLTFFILTQILHAQKHDYIWITGDDNQTHDTTYGGSLLDFNFNPVKASYHYRDLNMFTTNSSICDSAGNLLFYTNGCAIAGADDEILENGDNINPGSSHTLWCATYDDGYAGGPHNSTILPLPDSSGMYYLFHKRFVLYSNPSDVIFDKLFYSIVDMNQNNGQGKVIVKNVECMSDTLARAEICAVKHANGKDWWVITPRRNSNRFYIFKFTREGIVDTFQQVIGIMPDPNGEGLGQIVFSPDGSKLYRTYRYSPVMVYTFNREVGMFTQFDTIHYEYGDQLVGEIGCALSPNNRYLYLSCREFLYQLDLFAPDISASQTIVAEWDGFANPFPTMFWQCQLGPDCKIYVMAGGDTRFYHIIHNPDEPGLACNVEQRGLKLPTPSGASMPSFPNYRLGPLDNPGVPCTATVSLSPPLLTLAQIVSVYPNPVEDQVTFAWTEALVEEKYLFLRNALGQLVRDVHLSGSGSEYTMGVRELQNGVYFWEVYNTKGIRLGDGKIIKH